MKEIGRLLRSGITGCVLGTWANQVREPQLGGMVRIPVEPGYAIMGIIHDIHVDDDGLVRQLLSAPEVALQVIEDNRQNRNVPLEVSVLFVGSEREGIYSHLLPSRPPLSLDQIEMCDQAVIRNFTSLGFGYFRHLLRDPNLPFDELLAAHLQQAARAQNPAWLRQASQELILLLRDDYPRLMALMAALNDSGLSFSGN